MISERLPVIVRLSALLPVRYQGHHGAGNRLFVTLHRAINSAGTWVQDQFQGCRRMTSTDSDADFEGIAGITRPEIKACRHRGKIDAVAAFGNLAEDESSIGPDRGVVDVGREAGQGLSFLRFQNAHHTADLFAEIFGGLAFHPNMARHIRPRTNDDIYMLNVGFLDFDGRPSPHGFRFLRSARLLSHHDVVSGRYAPKLKGASGEAPARQKNRFPLIAQQCDFSFVARRGGSRVDDPASNVYCAHGYEIHIDSREFIPGANYKGDRMGSVIRSGIINRHVALIVTLIVIFIVRRHGLW